MGGFACELLVDVTDGNDNDATADCMVLCRVYTIFCLSMPAAPTPLRLLLLVSSYVPSSVIPYLTAVARRPSVCV